MAENEYETEFLDVSNDESQVSLAFTEEIQKFKNVVLKAIDLQTKAITNAINSQSQIIEKLLTAEREKLEILISSERESRKQLETKLDKLLSRFDINIVPQVTYMGTLIDTRQHE